MLQTGFSSSEINRLKLFKPGNCQKCVNGYKGRTGIYEIVPITKTLSEIMLNNGGALKLAEEAKKEGMQTLWQAAINKVCLGITSLEEIHRGVTHCN